MEFGRKLFNIASQNYSSSDEEEEEDYESSDDDEIKPGSPRGTNLC